MNQRRGNTSGKPVNQWNYGGQPRRVGRRQIDYRVKSGIFGGSSQTGRMSENPVVEEADSRTKKIPSAAQLSKLTCSCIVQ